MWKSLASEFSNTTTDIIKDKPGRMPRTATRLVLRESEDPKGEDNSAPTFRVLACDSGKFVDREEFQALFPTERKQKRIGNKAYVAIYKTRHRMSEVCTEMLAERETVGAHFGAAARRVVEAVQDSAGTGEKPDIDWIDVNSGKPQLHDSSSALFETDDCWAKLTDGGLTVMELGCCRCLVQKDFGAFVMIGVIFSEVEVADGVLEKAFGGNLQKLAVGGE